jgi:hypothetical protein
VADDHLKQTQRTITDPYERGEPLMAGAVGIAKVNGFGVLDEGARLDLWLVFGVHFSHTARQLV